MNKKVSVIIPVYNAEMNIENCIDSVVTQTYKSIEIILVNDGSNDSSGEICNRYKSMDNRIIYKKIENAGVSNARNVGLDLSTGDYVYFMDSDDTIDENHIETLIGKMNETVVAVNASINIIGPKSIRKIANHETVTIEEYKKDFIIKRYALRCWGWLLKSELAKSIRFDTNTNYFEDSLYILQYLFKCQNGNICFTDETYYNYYENQTSIVNNYKNIYRNIESVLYSINEVEKLYGMDKNIKYEYKKYLLKREIFLIENISKKLRYCDYKLIFEDDGLINELSKIKRLDIKFRYRIFICIVLKKKKIAFWIYLKIRKISKNIKDFVKKRVNYGKRTIS